MYFIGLYLWKSSWVNIKILQAFIFQNSPVLISAYHCRREADCHSGICNMSLQPGYFCSIFPLECVCMCVEFKNSVCSS